MSGSILYVSSGIGAPVECELAVSLFVQHLQKNYNAELVSCVESRSGYLKSAVLSSKTDLSEFLGDIQWICKSPIRKNHKRKNWFIRSFVCNNNHSDIRFNPDGVVFSTCKSSGPGGQHINKTESAVVAEYPPERIKVKIQSERSQHQNKQKAIETIKTILVLREAERKRDSDKETWTKKNIVNRGESPNMITFIGEEFTRKTT